MLVEAPSMLGKIQSDLAENKMFSIEGRRRTETPDGTSDGRGVKLVLQGLVRMLGKKHTAPSFHTDAWTAVWIAVWGRPGYCSGTPSLRSPLCLVGLPCAH